MGVLSNLEPASVFYYFEEICGIPHTSHHEKALSDYCVQFAKAHGLACRQDEMGNVLIKAPATPGYEKEPGLILQGHLDMVGDKTADCPLDLEKDAIHPVVDGGYVCAEGTTLGGDDGIAVAYALAVLDAKDIPHPALEVVLTVCEEVGLLGASAMDFSDLEGRILVNIDSEEEGVLTAGCAPMGAAAASSASSLSARSEISCVTCERGRENTVPSGSTGVESAGAAWAGAAVAAAGASVMVADLFSSSIIDGSPS